MGWTYGERAEREFIRGSAEPPAGSRAPRQGAPGQGAKPPEAETLLGFGAQQKQHICFILRILQTPKTPSNCNYTSG